MNLLMPARWDEDEIQKFVPTLKDCIKEKTLKLDFTHVSYVYPFSTMVLAIAIKELLEARHALKLNTSFIGTERNLGAMGYLKFFGFFYGLGVPVGNRPNGEAKVGRYLPITIITRQEIEEGAGKAPYQVEIDRHSDRLASIIFPGETNSGPAMMLSYCFREIIRNSFEHGEVGKCYVMAQRWWNGDAEITIADRGIGIYKSLVNTHKAANAEEAIRLAMMPGVTSGLANAKGTQWDNSGFGLYVTSELGKMYGDFSILSSEKWLKTVGKSDFLDVPIVGTCVKLKINTNDGDYFPNILASIVDEGEKIAAMIPGAVKSASKSSKLATSKS